jgi:hypothetical protein
VGQGMQMILDDYQLLKLLRNISNAPIELKFLILTLLAGLIYFYSIKRKKLYPNAVYKNEAILFIANMVLAGELCLIRRIISPFLIYLICPIYFLYACIYGIVAYVFRSKSTWIITIFFLYIAQILMFGHAYIVIPFILVIIYPINFLLFSIILIASSFIIKEKIFLLEFRSTTYKMGLLFLCVCLWLFSNYDLENLVWPHYLMALKSIIS